MGQEQSPLLNLPSMTPPSPNAISLGKYGDVPVGLYTGIPNINVPLYSIKVGNFTLPISLSYHSQGLKVEENAGWVGLGWSLNAGGTITRTVHGLPDDGPGGFWNYPNWTTDSVAALGAGTGAFFGGALYDLQPDLFYFNFGSHSGKFMMDATSSHTAHFIPFENYRVSYQVNSTLGVGITQFQMVDDDGIIYVFGAVETATDESATTNITTYHSAWYLTQIIAPAGTINFNYVTDNTYTYQTSEIDYLNTDVTSQDNRFNPGYSGSQRYLSYSSPILSSISFPTGIINFNLASNRKDQPTASAVTGFTVSGLDGAIKHQFVFSESYFGNTAETQPLSTRLKLDSVTEISLTDNNQVKKYKFGYNNPAGVPIIQSKAQDYWGFYNGQNGNTSLLPALDPTVYGTFIAGQQGSFHGNRSPSASAAMTGVLNSITYPTGGTSTFVYEGNDYGTIAGIPQIEHPVTEEHAVASASWSARVHALNDTVTFNLDSSQIATLTYTGSYGGGATPEEDGPTVILQRVAPDGIVSVFSAYSVNASATAYPNLTAGNYQLITFVDDSLGSIQAHLTYYYVDSAVLVRASPTGGLRIREIINTDPVSGQTNTKTYHYTSPTDSTASSGNLVSLPVYYELQPSYTFNTTWAMVSSTSLNYMGFTQGSHVAYNTVTELDSGSQYIGKKVSYFNASDYANPPGALYYTKLPGVVDKTNTNGSTIYKYQTDYDVLRGLLEKEITYNAQGYKVKQSLFNYSISDSFSNTSPNYYQVDAFAGWTYWMCHMNCSECFCPDPLNYPSGCYTCGNYALSNYTLAKYSIICPWIYKTSETDSTYDVDGGNPIGKTIFYYYDNPAHGLVTRTVTVDSKLDTLETLNKYSPDQAQIGDLSSVASNALSTMTATNRISTPIEVDHYNNGSLMNTLRVDYNVWNATPLVVEPQHVWYSILSNPLEDRVDYYQYDTCSNIMEASKSGDAHHSYIWDYHRQNLIAQVLNAQQNDVAYTSFEADGSGNWSLTGGTIDTTQAITGRNSYQNGSIAASSLNPSTTYIVSYWSQNGAYSIPGTISGYPKQGKTISYHTPGWTLYVHKVTGESTITVNATGHIDELRLYPATAQMTTYTYDPLVGMTSQMDAGSRATYYEYDGLQRLKRVRDQDYNILKTIQYAYQAPAGCGNGCQSVAMQTFAGTNTLSYPVGVFDVNGALLGNASNASAYVGLWNNDTADARVGILSAGQDSMHFNLTLNAGQTMPASVTGLRFYQVDLAWNQIDAVRQYNGAYIDFGDGTGIRMPASESDTPAVHPPNTVYMEDFDYLLFNEPYYYFIHNYPDTSLKTITCYHNDAVENSMFDNELAPASSLIRLRNLRGNLPAHSDAIGGSCYQDGSMTNLQGILNWNQITTIQSFVLNNGDGTYPVKPVSYPQDFLAGDKGLNSIETFWSAWPPNHRYGNGDTSFRLSRLRSDWNTYFTSLWRIWIQERDWKREDLSKLAHLSSFALTASDTDGGTEPGGPYTPLDSTEIDNVLIQIANGAGQAVSNGAIAIATGGSGRTTASNSAVNFLISKGWTIIIDQVTQVTQ